MPYAVEFSPRAARELRRLPRAIQLRLVPRIEALADDPRPAGTEKLAGPTDRYRIRLGDYRVIYEIRDRLLFVLVVRIGHRREVYRA